jgi:hypothetical protein
MRNPKEGPRRTSEENKERPRKGKTEERDAEARDRGTRSSRTLLSRRERIGPREREIEREEERKHGT